MINNILDLSKIEAGKMELSIEEVELHDALESAVATARGLVKEKDIKLIDDTPDQLPTVMADRTRVRQILLNLLQNAVKFTDEGTITLTVDIIEDPDTKASFAKLSVRDTGIGISTEDQAMLFERFSQVDSSLTRKVGGTGLGLSITKHLVEMQGGIINLESSVGKGSTFFFTVPVATPATEDEEVPEPVALGSKVILSIDDDEKVISLYKRYLSSHGFQVISLTDPTTALEQIKKIKPHAITLDIMMPSIDGWQVIQQIKSDPETSDIPVIICSIVEDKDKGYKLGATDYLVKPILEDELVRAIQRLKLDTDQEFHDLLVIDDDPNVLYLIDKAIRKMPNINLLFAEGGLRGLEMLKDKQPDALILDLLMPDLDGFSILETMQQDPALKKIPVIILTAADLTAEDRARIEDYKQELIKKDMFKEDVLISHLERALDTIEN
jgi:CheY-like chemotaxis protein